MKLLIGLAGAAMASALAATGAAAQSGAPTEVPGEPPSVEAPKAAGHGDAVADGGGSDSQHIAWTVGAGPGNDIGLYESSTGSTNSVDAKVRGNAATFTGTENTVSQGATIDGLSNFGQASASQNAGQHAIVSAGTSVNFVFNQGATNDQTVLQGGILSDFSVDDTQGADGSTHLLSTLDQQAAPDIQSAVADGVASASGGGKNTVHMAHSIGSGSGNDVGFDNSTLVSANDVLGRVTSNVVAFAATGGANNLTQLASLTNIDSNGQISLTQNAGNNSIVSAGTAVGFIANVTTLPSSGLGL